MARIAAEETGAARRTPSIIGRAIDQAKLTRALRFIIAVAAIGYFFDSFDNALISYALPSIAREFELRPEQLGLVGSAALAGMAVGSLFWGWISDHWGRSIVFASTILVFALFTGLAAFAFSAGFVIGVRFLAGTGLGGAIPVDGALLTEYAPARLRGRMGGSLPLAFPLGIFAAAGVGLLIVPTLGWRWLFVVGVLPALLTYFVRRGIPESPRWLASRGRLDEAGKSLEYIGIDDDALQRARQAVAAEGAPEVQPHARVSELFRPIYLRRVVHTWSMWFFSSLAGWAFTVWLPTIYATVYHIELTRTLTYTFLIAGTQVVGRLVAFSLVDRIGRKPVIVYGFVLAGIAAWLFNLAQTEMALVLVALLYAFFGDQGSFGMTVYTPEVYPLRIRGLGTSWAMALGRTAGAISPFTVGLLVGSSNIALMWWLMGGCQVVAGLSTLLLAKETRGVNLEEVSETPDQALGAQPTVRVPAS